MDDSLTLQDRFLEYFFAEPFGKHFYLTGGTALARFYFHHRESLDMDLFTNDQAQDFFQINQTMLAIQHRLDLRISSQATTDAYIQYILTSSNDIPLKPE